jgi:hypothetical protein
MDNRKFLDKIRKLQDSGKKIGLTEIGVNTNNLINESRNKFLLTEEEQTIQPDEQKEEENKFKDIVSKLVKFEPIVVYPENVTWEGMLVREKIKWVFSLDETNGCYISIEGSDMLQLTMDSVDTLKKLRSYYEVWSDEWSSRLTGAKQSEESTEEPMGGEEPVGDELGGETGF